MKSENGITLIALVITIVIMLILVVASLNMGIGRDSIIENTQQATEKTMEAESKEYILEAWAYILANVPDNQMPYSNDVNSKTAHSIAAKLFLKYISGYGTGSLEADASENYVVTIKVNGKRVKAYKIKFRLKGNSEDSYFYMVNDTEIYSEKEISL